MMALSVILRLVSVADQFPAAQCSPFAKIKLGGYQKNHASSFLLNNYRCCCVRRINLTGMVVHSPHSNANSTSSLPNLLLHCLYQTDLTPPLLFFVYFFSLSFLSFPFPLLSTSSKNGEKTTHRNIHANRSGSQRSLPGAFRSMRCLQNRAAEGELNVDSYEGDVYKRGKGTKGLHHEGFVRFALPCCVGSFLC